MNREDLLKLIHAGAVTQTGLMEKVDTLTLGDPATDKNSIVHHMTQINAKGIFKKLGIGQDAPAEPENPTEPEKIYPTSVEAVQVDLTDRALTYKVIATFPEVLTDDNKPYDPKDGIYAMVNDEMVRPIMVDVNGAEASFTNVVNRSAGQSISVQPVAVGKDGNITGDALTVEALAPVVEPENVETAKPAETEKSTESAKPAETEKSAESEKPAETEKSTESEKPAETEKPAESEKPATTSKKSKKK